MPETPTPTPPPPSAGATAAERALHARLDAIEAAEARLKRQGLLNLVGLALILGLAAGLFVFTARRGVPGATNEVVESREYRLRDKDGRVRGAWGFADDGAIRLVLQNAGDQRALRLHLLPDGSAGITFNDSTGAARVILGLLPDGTSSLVFADRAGTARSVYSLTPNGSSSVIFADQGGTTRAIVGVDQRGNALLSGDAAVPAADEEPTVLDTATAGARTEPPKR